MTIDPLALGEVLALERALTSAAVPGLLGTVPSYASMAARPFAAGALGGISMPSGV